MNAKSKELQGGFNSKYPREDPVEKLCAPDNTSCVKEKTRQRLIKSSAVLPAIGSVCEKRNLPDSLSPVPRSQIRLILD